MRTANSLLVTSSARRAGGKVTSILSQLEVSLHHHTALSSVLIVIVAVPHSIQAFDEGMEILLIFSDG